jgi:putative transposase
MPRTPRGALHAHVFHVLNRGNGRREVFHKEEDYRAFLALLERAKQRASVRVFAFCLLANHFHIVLQPGEGTSLSVFMHWWLTSHVRRYHRHYGTSGHVWQGRFKSFPVQCDEHFLTVVRYVLLNPVRARVATNPFDWPWSSLHLPGLVDDWPLSPPRDWDAILAQTLSDDDLQRVRNSVRRQAPFGAPLWQEAVARLGGLESSLRPRGRPRKPTPA